VGLAEGAIRKDGQPAKKPGYVPGSAPENVGRPPSTTCALPECVLPPAKKRPGQTGPKSRYCSPEHARQDYRRYHLHQKYDLTNEAYDEMLAEQGGVCKICGDDDPHAPGRPRKDGTPGQGSFHVDHDKETGKVRGLLCSGCNRGLGQFRERPSVIDLAAEYLREFDRSIGRESK